jgi:hypothetical protein
MDESSIGQVLALDVPADTSQGKEIFDNRNSLPNDVLERGGYAVYAIPSGLMQSREPASTKNAGSLLQNSL